MLQQTQVERVIPKYRAFLKTFPTVEVLARASTKDVLTLWSGLGYNNRALRLKRAAEEIVQKYRGRVPKDKEALIALPAIGPYTAGAIRAFAFGERDIFLETNIRTVFVHEFFSKTKRTVADTTLLALVEATLPAKDFRGWYSALMDYGAELKSKGKSQNAKTKNYTKQSAFRGSNREARGAILRILLVHPMSVEELSDKSGIARGRIIRALEGLSREKSISKKGGRFLISQA